MVKKISTVALAAALTIPCALAQGYSPASIELLKEQRLWFHSANAAGATLDDTRNYTDISLDYSEQQGDYHRPQQGDQVSNAGVDCEGFMNLGSALVWGEFSFKQLNVNRSMMNASIADPYRGMPFFYGDDKESNWRNQNYRMKFRASTPLLSDKWAIGIEGTYKATIVAKQLDPRVDSRYFELGLNPSAVWAINKSNSLGATFEYTALKEDSRMSLVNASIAQTYYLFYGLGMAEKVLDYGRSSDYHGHRLGGELQYGFNQGNLNTLLTVGYGRRVENIENLKYSETSVTVPENKASVKSNELSASLQVQLKGDKWHNHLNLAGSFNQLKGIKDINTYVADETNPGWELVTRDVRSKYDSYNFGADYSLLNMRDASEYAWRADASLTWNKNHDVYYLPEASRKVSNFYASLGGKYNFAMGEKLNRRLLVGASYGYLKNLSAGYCYSDMMPDSPAITLEEEDLRALSANAWNLAASVTYSQAIKADNRMNAYARAEINYVKATTNDFSHRRYINFAVGFTF